jgi:hypothetical protein
MEGEREGDKEGGREGIRKERGRGIRKERGRGIRKEGGRGYGKEGLGGMGGGVNEGVEGRGMTLYAYMCDFIICRCELSWKMISQFSTDLDSSASADRALFALTCKL